MNKFRCAVILAALTVTASLPDRGRCRSTGRPGDRRPGLCQLPRRDGIATFPGAPNLAGQPEEYVQRQLHAYRSGERKNEQMSVVVSNLSDDDLDNLAAWYAAIRVTVEVPGR
ncbi:MAG: cytochrome c [Burkholderiaceae bacterium]